MRGGCGVCTLNRRRRFQYTHTRSMNNEMNTIFRYQGCTWGASLMGIGHRSHRRQRCPQPSCPLPVHASHMPPPAPRTLKNPSASLHEMVGLRAASFRATEQRSMQAETSRRGFLKPGKQASNLPYCEVNLHIQKTSEIKPEICSVQAPARTLRAATLRHLCARILVPLKGCAWHYVPFVHVLQALAPSTACRTVPVGSSAASPQRYDPCRRRIILFPFPYQQQRKLEHNSKTAERYDDWHRHAVEMHENSSRCWLPQEVSNTT
jgi:hypothetical protein